MKNKLNINESFICRIWEGGEAYYSNLVTDTGEEVQVIDFGRRNYDSGPDYKDAKVKIGGKTYTGDIEIHRDYSNWAEHSHPKDRKYNSVILHVVLWDSENKIPPKLRIKRDLPTVILAEHLNNSIHNIWQDVISKPSEKFKLPCYGLNSSISDEIILSWFKKLSMQRLKLKTERMKERLEEIEKEISGNVKPGYLKKKGLWEQVLYEFTFEALGYSKNKEQMLRLSQSLKLSFFRGKDLIPVQSLLYGTAGFLFDLRNKDEYIDKIKKYWRTLAVKVTTPRLNRSEWNFFRLRPQNFPTLRIAYGSQLILKIMNDGLLKNVTQCFCGSNLNLKQTYKKLSGLFEPAEDGYWNSHYDFGKASKTAYKLLGSQRINDIIINVIIPLVYLYSDVFKISEIKSNVLEFYNNLSIKPDNSIISLIENQILKKRNIGINSPSREQASIQLYNFYCVRERCNECEIGKIAFKNKGYEYKIIFY